MKRTAKLDYACKAILELGLHWPNETPVQVSQIAANQGIPMKFLVHILINLKQLGVVKSLRGKSGGYVLTKEPKDIRLSEVVMNFGSRLDSNHDEDGQAVSSSVMSDVWNQVDKALFDILDDITFEDIVNQERTRGKIPMYEI